MPAGEVQRLGRSAARLFALDQQRRGLSQRTVGARSAVIEALAVWLGRRPETATTEEIQAWLDTCRIGRQSRYTYIAHLHAFFAFCLRAKLVRRDPTVDIERPKVPKGVPRPITPEDFADVVQQAPSRMRAWLLLGAFEGMRRQEIAGLERADILETLEEPALIVSRGKGSRERVVPLNPLVWDALVAFGLPRRGPVFRGPDGQALRPETIGQEVATFLRAHGVDATCHQLRHTFGTEVYQASRDIRLVQELLGHASVTTTAIYTKFAPASASRFVRSLRPRPRRQQPLPFGQSAASS